MNKLYFLLAAVALVGAVAAGPAPDVDYFPDEEYSEKALIPSDEDEVSELKVENAIFSDFCLKARDEVRLYLAESANGVAAKIFNVMFNSIADIQTTAMEVQGQTVQDGVKKIQASHLIEAKPSTELQTRDQIEQEYDATLKTIEQRRFPLLAAIGAAFKDVINAILATLASETAKRLALLRANLDGSKLREQVEFACSDMSYKLKGILSRTLEKSKAELSQSSEAVKFRDVIARTKIEDIGCVTTNRVTKIQKFCSLMQAAGPIIFNVLGWN